MKKKNLFLYFVLILIQILCVELFSYFLLVNLSLNATFDKGNKTLLHIKNYIVNPENLDAQPRYYPQHTVRWINNPNYHIDGEKQNNSFGYRGAEFNLFKEEKAIRIACIGGSTTYGFGVSKESETYPFILEELLAKKYPEKEIEVLNVGLNAASSIEEIMNYQFKIKYFKPDIVILKSGGNDASYQYDRPESYAPDMSNAHDVYIDVPAVNPSIRFLFNSNFVSIIHLYINYIGLYNQNAADHGMVGRDFVNEKSLWFPKDLDFALTNAEYYSFYQNFDLLTDLFIKDTVQIYAMPFILNPYTENDSRYEDLNNTNNAIMEEMIIRKSGVWMSIWEDDFPENAWIGDDCHFNLSGNTVCAEKVAAYINF